MEESGIELKSSFEQIKENLDTILARLFSKEDVTDSEAVEVELSSNEENKNAERIADILSRTNENNYQSVTTQLAQFFEEQIQAEEQQRVKDELEKLVKIYLEKQETVLKEYLVKEIQQITLENNTEVVKNITNLVNNIEKLQEYNPQVYESLTNNIYQQESHNSQNEIHNLIENKQEKYINTVQTTNQIIRPQQTIENTIEKIEQQTMEAPIVEGETVKADSKLNSVNNELLKSAKDNPALLGSSIDTKPTDTSYTDFDYSEPQVSTSAPSTGPDTSAPITSNVEIVTNPVHGEFAYYPEFVAITELS